MSRDGIRSKPGPNARPVPKSNAAAPAKPATTAPAHKPNLLHRVESDFEAAGSTLVHGINEVEHELTPHPFAEGRDGFVAFDPQTGAISGGHAAGTTVRTTEASDTPFGPLLRILGRGLKGDDVTFRVGDKSINPSGTTGENGEQMLPLDAERSLLKGVNAKTGGVVSVGISAKGAGNANANVLALPRDYDGPIFVSDIDDSLRPTQVTALAEGKTQAPIPGAKELLDGVSKLGVPIVYLSAGASQIHSANEAFLAQFPKGVLLDNDHYGLANFNPSNAAQARLQADYKANTLAELHATYPHAKIFGLGDDKYGDAMAYAKAGATAYIHNVSADQANVPAGFQGVITDDYTPAFHAKVLGDLSNALKQSQSFGGSPDAKVSPVPAPANPPPIPKPSLVGKIEHFFNLAKMMGKGVPSEAGNVLLDKLRGNAGVAKSVGAMTPEQMAQLPMSARAHLADELLRDPFLGDVLRRNGDPKANGQLALSLITAGGTDAGPIDAVLSRMHVNATDALQGPAKAQLDALVAARAATPGDWSGFQRYLDSATGTTQRPGTQVTPLIDGKNAFPAMYQAIDAAKSSINYTVFAFQSDQTGWEMARHLAAASDRGVAVKVLYDTTGSSHSQGLPTDPAIYDFMRAHGVQVLTQLPGPLGAHLSHRKITVVDGKVAFTGGMNVGDQYSSEWHDVHSKIEGPAVADLQKLFVTQWQADGGKAPTAAEQRALFPSLSPVAGAGSARVIGHVGGQGDEDIKLAYLRAIDTAQHTINIADPYFSDPDVVRHLCAAAQRGVIVKLVFPRHNDSSLEQDAERALYENLRAAGVHVYEYQGPMAHDKVATFDGAEATIGSSNLDARSLVDNDEANVWSSDPAIAKQLDEQLFSVDLSKSQEILHYKPNVLGWAAVSLAHKFANLL